MPSVEVNGLELAYERAGEGPPLLFAHGVLCDSRAWRPQLAGLSDELTVVAWDEPGAGRSVDPPEPFGLTDYADCLAGVIEALGLGPAAVAGLSWGGIVAQELYRRRPKLVAGLILADTYAGWAGSLTAEACAARLASCLGQATMPANEVVEQWMPGLLSRCARRQPSPTSSPRFSPTSAPLAFASRLARPLRRTRETCSGGSRPRPCCSGASTTPAPRSPSASGCATRFRKPSLW